MVCHLVYKIGLGSQGQNTDPAAAQKGEEGRNGARRQNHSEFLSRLGVGLVNGLYFLGYSMTDAAPALGDSAITETDGGRAEAALAATPTEE